MNTQIAALERNLRAVFETHPEAEIYRSQPGLGPVLAMRVLAASSAMMLSATRTPGRGRTTPRPARSPGSRARRRPWRPGSCTTTGSSTRWPARPRALVVSPGARRYYDELRARGVGHFAALRQLANRLVGILHGCLKTGTSYAEQIVWNHRHRVEAA